MSETKKPQLHASALEMKCLEAFRRRYIENEIIPPGVAALVGTATDAGITRNLGNKIKTGQLLPVDECIDTARDALNAAWETGVRLDDDEAKRGIKIVKGGAIDKAVRLSTLHHKELAPIIQPSHVQRKWALSSPGYPCDIVGAIDIQESAESIRDTKTSENTPRADIAHRSVQLSAYALAVELIDGRPPARVFLDYLIDRKTPQAKPFESVRTEEHFKAVLARVEVYA